MQRPVVELATSRSQVRRPNHYTTEPLTRTTLYKRRSGERTTAEITRLDSFVFTDTASFDFDIPARSSVRDTINPRITRLQYQIPNPKSALSLPLS